IGERSAGDGGDRMVRAKDDAVPTNTLDDMLDIGAERVGGPTRIAVIDDARDLADDIGERGDLGEGAAPGIEAEAVDVGIAAMVEHKGELGDELCQAHAEVKLIGAEAEVEGEVVR